MARLRRHVTRWRRRHQPTGPPDFIGVGAPDSDNRRWHHLVLRHPDVHGSPAARRLGFFAEFCTREMQDADVAAYHALFPRPPGGIVGEWTPRYMVDPWTPRLLQRCAPDARIIAMVSDPLLRVRLSLARARETAEDPEERLLVLVDAIARGRYGLQLRNLREWFPPERILVLQTEQCHLDPLGEFARTLRFLGVSDDFVPRRYRRLAAGETGPRWYVRVLQAAGMPEGFGSRAKAWIRRDPPPVEPVELWPELEASLLAELRPEAEDLATMVPEIDLSLWPGFAPR